MGTFSITDAEYEAHFAHEAGGGTFIVVGHMLDSSIATRRAFGDPTSLVDAMRTAAILTGILSDEVNTTEAVLVEIVPVYKMWEEG